MAVRKRNTKMDRAQLAVQLMMLWNQLSAHIGQPAILIQHEGRTVTSHLVTLTSQTWGKGILAHSKCYAPDGSFRCFIKHNIDVVKLLIGEQELTYLNEGV